ncbi:MAG: nitroreductase [Synergistaceae bacterium]|nr:nitroreductase [Synergistaceae bacterium]
MNVIEAISVRRSTRAFLSKSVERDKITTVLEAAVRTPSWANTQPWEVFVATGDTLDRIKKQYQQKHAESAKAAPETPRPTEWPDAAKNRIQQMHKDMKIDCGDAVEQFAALNQSMFNAPAVIYICMDKSLSQWSLYDIGAYSQNILLAAVEQGLAAIQAINLVQYPDVLRRELKIPDNLKITIGIAIGYPDKENKINNFVSRRTSLEETVRFLD